MSMSFIFRNAFLFEPENESPAPAKNQTIRAMRLQKANFMEDNNRIIKLNYKMYDKIITISGIAERDTKTFLFFT